MIDRLSGLLHRRLRSAFAGFAHQVRFLSTLEGTGSMSVSIAPDECSVEVRFTGLHVEFAYRETPGPQPRGFIVVREVLAPETPRLTRHLSHYALLGDGLLMPLSHGAGARPLAAQDLVTAAVLVGRAHHTSADYAALALGPSPPCLS